jgi:hypothetical protein
MKSVRRWSFIAAGFSALAAGIAFGVGYASMPGARKVADEVASRDWYGAVALSGDTTLVSNPDLNGTLSAVDVYTRTGTTWTSLKLTPSDAKDFDNFGISLALAGDTAFVGAPWKDSDHGAVYVFARGESAWTQEAELTVTDARFPQNGFGSSVALAVDTAVLGSRGNDAYVFARAGTVWTQQATLPTDNYEFTVQQVALSGDTAAVGVDYDGSYGEVYVFTRTGASWTPQAVLRAPGFAEFDRFGGPVALAGDTLVVGAYGTESRRGVAHVFRRTGTTWTLEATLSGPPASSDDGFGSSVAIEGDTALVGAYRADSRLGAVFVFTRSGAVWTHRAKLISEKRNYLSEFGYSVALSGDTAAVSEFEDYYSDQRASWFTLPADILRARGNCVPTNVNAKIDRAHPERSTLTASGTLDTGPVTPDFSGAATFDIGGFHLSVPAFVPMGNSLRYSADGITLTVRPAINGSSRAGFSVNIVGDLTGKVDLSAPLALRFTNAANDLNGAVNLKNGRLASRRVASPDLAVVSAAAKFRGSGKDSFRVTLAWAAVDATPKDPVYPRLAVGFGNTYAALLESYRNPRVFTGLWSGAAKVRAVVNRASGTIMIAGKGVDLGPIGGGDDVRTVSVTMNGRVYSAQVRMARVGTKLKY